MENITEYFAHSQAVCTRPLLGGEGPGNEPSVMHAFDTMAITRSLTTIVYSITQLINDPVYQEGINHNYASNN